MRRRELLYLSGVIKEHEVLAVSSNFDILKKSLIETLEDYNFEIDKKIFEESLKKALVELNFNVEKSRLTTASSFSILFTTLDFYNENPETKNKVFNIPKEGIKAKLMRTIFKFLGKWSPF